MPGGPTITNVKRRWGLRSTDWLLFGYLVLCASVVVVGLAARSGLDARPENYNIYEPWQFGLGFPCVIVGGYLVLRVPRHPLGWLFVAAGGLQWMSPTLSTTIDRGWLHPSDSARVALFLGGGGWVWFRGIVLVLVALAYPMGPGHSRRRRAVFAAATLVVAMSGIVHALPFATVDFTTFQLGSGWYTSWDSPLMRTVMVLALAAQLDLIGRMVRLPRIDRRRHLPVAVAALLLMAPTTVSAAQSVGWLDGFDHPEIEFVAAMILPLALAYGVLRHGALGFRTVVRRSALYGGVATVAAAIYVGVVWSFSVLVQDNTHIGPAVATGLVAASLQPVHAVVRSLVDRWVFGDRNEPYRALSGLGRRLGDTDDDPLAVVAEVVRSSLKLAAVTIEWDGSDGEPAVVARALGSQPAGAVERVPILFEGRRVADLVVIRPQGERAASAAEECLLADLAGAAGAVVQSALYADEVARSRGNLVRAREEERRRLRHDLHDGLGPTLASVAMGLDAAATRLRDDPELAGLLRDLDRALQDAIADIRRLVAGLRPPALDDLGLVPALREQAFDMTNRSRRADGPALAIDITASPGLPVMAAAVEVAAYRIAVEGMTNVLRHAGAKECTVRLASAAGPEGDALEVVVEDDGRGIEDSAIPGIGLESMRNRAEELGGRLRIGRRPGGGTVLAALIPLYDPRRELASA